MFWTFTRYVIQFYFLFFIFYFYVFGNDFSQWIDHLKNNARKFGISEKVIEKSFSHVHLQLNSVVIKENNQTTIFPDYYKNFSSRARLEEGKKLLKKYHLIFNTIYKKYHVSPYILISLWNIETHYGKIKGKYSIINALATISFNSKRRNFFAKELIYSLKIIELGARTPENFLSGWAGASGQFQFMPYTYIKYATSYLPNGKKDIWNNIPDSMASAANYLHSLKWSNNEPVLVQVHIPIRLASWQFIKQQKTIKEWKKLGVKLFHHIPSYQKTKLILPIGYYGPAFLVFKNYTILKKWNHSNDYALTAGLIMEYLAHHWIYKNYFPKQIIRLTKKDIIDIQTRLKNLSLFEGQINGRLNFNTRKSIALFQEKHHMISDGYPNIFFIKTLMKQ